MASTKKWLARAAIAVVALAALVWGLYRVLGGAEGIVATALPEFPEWPAPVDTPRSGQQGRILFASATPFDLDVLLGAPERARPTTGIGTLRLPPGASPDRPVPAMVVLHGSGGITPGREKEYGELLADHGYAAFVLDYYAPRGLDDETPYMLRVVSTTEFDALTDAYSALRLLSRHPDIDANRIGIMGFSYGGMATRLALDRRIADALAGDGPRFAAHVDYYGPCFQNLHSPAVTGAPLLTLRGTRDASNDLEACQRREAELRALGTQVESHVYEGAGHAWEAEMPRKLLPDLPYVAGCEIEYDATGHAHVGDRLITDLPLDASREARIAARMASGDLMGECVRYGYVVGRDEATQAKSDAHLLAFLDRVLR